MIHGRVLCAITVLCSVAACVNDTSQPEPLSIDSSAITRADETPELWLSHGRDYAEQRFSPLTKIDATNVNRLGLAFEVDLESHRGLEATPLFVDDTLYLTSTWSRVYAVDARTGTVKWKYDPKVPRSWGIKLCCDIVNRGVALHGDAVFVGTIDGRLVAINRHTGEQIWEVDTLVDRDRNYSITGAPRVVKDKVIIGNGGAEFPVRGYITAYDLANGDLAWRFFTVPGDPNQPFEHPELEQAAKTWQGVTDWGGLGGTAWDGMAYDPELNLLYVGTGNGSPWSRARRSPAGGDNLFLSSILALNPDSGRLVWHYQTTPGDNWDYTATQNLILADH